MPDYSNYFFSWKERGICILAAAVASGAAAWLFYRSMYALLLFFPALLFIKKEMQRLLLERQKSNILFQFKDMLQLIAAALKAGYSIENAFGEAEKEFAGLYGKKEIMSRELAAINGKIKMNVSVECLLEDLAERTKVEEISSFSQVFGFAKRSGGDMIKIFQDSTEKIKEKTEVIQEIETVTAAKRMEQKIMALVPFGILVYLGIGMPDYLEPLYGNSFGIFMMSTCLVVYLITCKMAQRIVDIRV